MPGLKAIALNGLAAAVGVSAFAVQQKPILHDQQAQAPIGGHLGSTHGDRPLVDSEALQDTIKADNLLARAKHLYKIAKLSEDKYGRPTRVIGSPGHEGTIKYIQKALNAVSDYYTFGLQPFSAVSGTVFESRLTIDDKLPFTAYPMSLTPPTKNREPVDGNLVLVSNEGCNEEDYPDTLSGNIAFIKRGICPFGTKSELAGKAGALAAVVYNYEDAPVGGTLGTPSDNHVATFGLSGREARPHVAKLEAGKTIPVTAYIDAVVNQIVTNNIIAQTKGGDQENCVMLGGHSDSVGEGPGINDDGSGSLSLLEVALNLANFSVNNCVRFAWWSAEEEGLLGSDHYVNVLAPEENKKIRLFMDYDMLASPNFAYQVYDARDSVNPVGSQALRDLYVNWYTKHGLNYTFIPFDGRSDYDGFIRHGIPAGGIATGAEGIKLRAEAQMFGGEDGVPYDVCYHELCDDVHNLNLTAWEINTKLVAHSVAAFATSFDGFPKRTLDDDKLFASTNKYRQQTKYHGDKLFI
ncbi:hypothetical protein B0T21DRAFT_353897 [Apiosordaria backusii]|uniref:Peptide hydrolase n=1 Tax=Apiosordaria backusii TaxID=314023 RepID=A0AA40EXM6_9PEZI|nr:hypothetical protein B0T21DRAFT_353897 [Apiosordaria backusii]